MKWAFVDYENLGTLEGIPLTGFARVLVFLGAQNPRIQLGTMPGDRFVPLEILQLRQTSANNVDFHLAFFLGQMHAQAPAEIKFEVFSGDQGYDPLLKFLNQQGRSCVRRPGGKAKAVPKAKAAPLPEGALTVLKRLHKMKEPVRPKKVDKLQNWIQSQMKDRFPGEDAAGVVKVLQTRGVLKAEGSQLLFQAAVAEKLIAREEAAAVQEKPEAVKETLDLNPQSGGDTSTVAVYSHAEGEDWLPF